MFPRDTAAKRNRNVPKAKRSLESGKESSNKSINRANKHSVLLNKDLFQQIVTTKQNLNFLPLYKPRLSLSPKSRVPDASSGKSNASRKTF